MDQNLLKRIKRRDRVARWVITAGGFSVIFCVALILVLIVRVTLPLFQASKAEVFAKLAPEALTQNGARVLAAGLDDYLENSYVLAADGSLSLFNTLTGELLGREPLAPPGAADALPVDLERSGAPLYTLLWSDGAVSVDALRFVPRFDERGQRSIVHRLERLGEFASVAGDAPQRILARPRKEDGVVLVRQFGDSRLLVTHEVVTRSLFGGESREAFEVELGETAGEVITALALDSDGSDLYAGTARGELLHWSLSDPQAPRLAERVQAFPDRRAITALALVFGDASLAVGDEQGGLSTWFRVRVAPDRAEFELRHIHTLKSHPAAVTAIVPSQRDKSLLSLNRKGTAHYDHMTSGRHLLALDALNPLAQVSLNGRNTGLIALDSRGEALVWRLDVPHAEVSLRTLFGKVWYEGYPEPAYVWQSSSGTDDFEPKMSLTPLIFGTIKGTFYAMLFAVPLALLAAIYTSSFARPRFREMVKPTVEVMAAIPSVVIGFLAALWLAPLLERNIASFFLSAAFIPSFLLLGVLLWQALRKIAPLRKVERGFEFLTLVPILLLAIYAAFALGPWFEQLVFGGDFKLWLFNETGVRYDPRNCIVIAFALGFAVIPIIFTIAEDSLSNVPGSLKAASLALGASRWQTAWRVVLPSASPGIFAGTMIGLGRAIGETMIVLMATGNTAIMDWIIFNGMRPLSANIAVEIPEAPVGGTLYRVLFLSAVLLFMMTFVLNTAAEVFRQRLRKKYGRF
ncbi:ABC transporter permease subunit [Geoalkalibacter sp.]|uniref:ABC transporter permease subunit n=1 Tax=Geoalkalibacter sp. TaxID=3041440 RepID=UPI00272DD2B3|nr:ABC transporter permease subunit [Geoalkalibacter sp.]